MAKFQQETKCCIISICNWIESKNKLSKLE
nr:MAG TPA: hypothetical protein [Caudoviricetes sp.]